MTTTTTHPPQTKTSASTTAKSHIVRRLVTVVLLSVAIGSLLLAVPGLQGVSKQIAQLDPVWVVVAVALELGSCLAFVVIFRHFFNQVPRAAARELAWVEQGAGALLPGGGVGALAVGGWFLRREGVSKRHVIERSSALFFLTSAINVIALVAAGGLLVLGVVGGPHDLLRAGLPALGGLVAAAAVLFAPVLIRRTAVRRRAGLFADLVDGIDGARHSLVRPSWRLIGALGYLGLDIAALGATFAAMGHPLPIAPLVLAYLLGYLANLIPVPGGFGVLEGGLAGALIIYGASATQAAAAVIVYHAIAFWIPSLGGLLAYALLRRRVARSEAVGAAKGVGRRGPRAVGPAPAAAARRRRPEPACVEPRRQPQPAGLAAEPAY